MALTPTFNQILAIFRKQEEETDLLVEDENGNTRPLREVAENNDCTCSSCNGVKRALGLLPVETESDERELMAFLIQFLDGAPPLVRLILQNQIVNEAEQGMFPGFNPNKKAEEGAPMLPSHTSDQDATSQKDTNDMNDRKQIQTQADEGLKAVAAVLGQLADANSSRFKNTKVVRDGEKIILPNGMSTKQGIEVLQQQLREDETNISVDIVIDAYPFEGARAFQAACAEEFGWVNRITIPGSFFRPETPPQMVDIAVDINRTESVMWGRLEIPAIDGFLQTQVVLREARFLFQIGGVVKKKSMPLVEKLGALTKEHVKKSSIYKGKAVRFSFPDIEDESSFDIHNSPKFIDTSTVNPNDLIFSHEVDGQIRRAIFNPIEHTETCRTLGIPLKRGALLAGGFGVGKSMTAAVTARKCLENGWTFFYLEKPEQLPVAIRFARNYQPAVIFVEDVDKVTKGERTKSLDDLLNAIDGVDTKGGELMLVFTTNQLNVINPAVLRAGRLDDIVEVLPPDADAVERLIRLYTRGLLEENTQLAPVAKQLAGQIPATISDVCTRAQLAAVPRAVQGKLQLRVEDLTIAAAGKLKELEMIKVERPTIFGSSVEKAGHILGTSIVQAVTAMQGPDSETSNGKKKAQPRANAS